MNKTKTEETIQTEYMNSEMRKAGVDATESQIIIWGKIQSDLKYWQRQLRLDDVDIELRWLEWDERPDKFAYFDDASACQLFEIGLRQPHHKQSMPIVRNFNSDYEVILVHELLHARYSRWYTGEVCEILREGVSNELFEVSIDAIAEALVRARRGINR